jgi:hypothetical protein
MDDGMLDHPKWIRALRDGGSDALHLWLRLSAWSSRHLTDGVIPADVVDEIPGPRGAKLRAKAQQALVNALLIERQSNGDLLLHDYLEYNPSRAEVLAERGRKAQNQRDRRLRGSVTGDSPECEAGESPVSHRVPSPPVPFLDSHTSRARPRVARLGPGDAESGDPSHLDPVNDVEPDSAPSDSAPAVPGLVVVAASTRVTTMPGPEPPQAYLDTALMDGVSREQARSTWKHYWGAGLPPGGVERLHAWLAQRAKERTTKLARASPRASPNPRASKQPNAGLTGFESLSRPKEHP